MICSCTFRSFCLLCLALLLSFPALGQQSGILREVYYNIPNGGTIPGLTNAPNYPDNPDFQSIESLFEAPSNIAEDYGQRMRALITAPATGNYIFWIASDDNGALFLSTDESPANKQLIATEPSWSAAREYTKDPAQQSAAISMVAGKRYYIEGLQSEGGGGDNLSVRWQLPSGAIEDPIPGTRMTPYGLTAPQIATQPQSLTVVEGGSAVFTVKLVKTLGATYLWRRENQIVNGETTSSLAIAPVKLTDSNAHFQCFITNAYGGTNTVVATLTVTADVTPPTLVSVGSLGDPNVVTLIFSEPLDPVSASDAGNYTLDQAQNVSNARLGADGRTVTLTTSSLSRGVTYTVTVNNVKDRATNPNTIAPNSQRTFTIDSHPLAINLLRPDPEPIGPSTRHTALTISEIMYHPGDRTDGRNLEYIELYNSNPWPEDISGFRFTGSVDYTFPTNFSLKAQGYLVVAPVPADITAIYGITNVVGGFKSQLRGTPGSIRLINRVGARILDVPYDDQIPWPPAADGAGHSLVLARPSWGHNDPLAWAQSDLIGGSPGKAETVGANPQRAVMINEFLAHTDDPLLDFIELYNYSAADIDISGCVLTDDPNTNKFVIPAGTTIAAGGFVSFDQNEMRFGLNASGETIYFKNAAGTRVIDAVKYEAQENGVSLGRFPDGAPAFKRLSALTKGAANAKPLTSDVVINEIMYAPISEDSNDEYVELYNRGTKSIDIGRWKFTSGISYTFPLNTFMAPGAYLVVAKNAGRLLTNYPNLTGANTLGNYSGTLANGGERIALAMPDTLLGVGANGLRTTNTIHVVVDEVTYRTGGRWGLWSKGGGSSLELIDARADQDLAPNWADSDESSKSGWVTIETTGVLDNGNDSANSLQILALRAGEYLVDDVQVIPQGGANLVPNGDFENGLAGWIPQGNHERSTLENTGYNSSKSLHVRATAHGDTGADRIRVALTQALSAGQTVTIRAKVKWLAGHPEILFRLHGNWLEATGNVLTAQNLGTPGLPNSRARSNLGPAITKVAHTPVIPSANQTVTVLARASDVDGLAGLVLKYRVDPSTNQTIISMANNGAGLFSATIPGQVSGTIVAFRIESADNATPSLISTFPNDAVRECLVRWGETTPAGGLGNYRLLISSTNYNRWSSREKLSNEPIDCTFVYNNFRVFYNMGGQYSGSPYHAPGFNTPNGNVCDYVLNFNEDDPFLGETDFALSWPGNGGGDNTCQREDTAYWIGEQIGIPFMYRRSVNVFVNGARRGLIFQDVQQPNGEVITEYYPDDDAGDLFKIQVWFEFDDAASTFSAVGANLGNYTTTGGVKKKARYRWNWAKRAFNGSANYYDDLFALVDTVNTTATGSNYTKQLNANLDVDNWLRTYAVEHIVGNNDSYAYGGGQNMYTYKGQTNPWRLMIWDIDFAFSSLGPTGDDLFAVGGGGVGPNLSHPPFLRQYYQALQDAANGPLVSTRYSPMLDAKYTAYRATGAAVDPVDGIKAYMSARRTYILGLLNNVNAAFAVTSGANYSVTNNLITLRGTAPVGVRSILFGGVAREVTWTTMTNWTINLALTSPTNSIVIAGNDKNGVQLGSVTVNVTDTAQLDTPEGSLVFNEIMYNPVVPHASYVELLNASATTSFDLSGWKIEGLGFAFPVGTVVAPGAYLLLIEDLAVFTSTYGAPKNLAGIFTGNLSVTGETFRLIRPDNSGAMTRLVNEVTFSNNPPWPDAANGGGASLQLIDPKQDDNRVGNWRAMTNNPLPAPQWQHVSATGNASSATLYVYLNSPGDVYIDDLKIVSGTTPDVGVNFVQNGDFESALTGPWTLSPNVSGSTISTSVKRSGNASLHLVATSAGTTQGSSMWQVTSPALTTGQTYTLSFWYLQNTNGGSLTARLSGSGIALGVSLLPGNGSQSPLFTPGEANNTAAILPPFPTLRLNEILPNNVTGATDALGHHQPWVELVNTSTNDVDLTGVYLSDSTDALLKWPLPSAMLGAGKFALVWLDGNQNESSATEWHASFTVPIDLGAVYLTRVQGTNTNIVDYLNYFVSMSDTSFGDFPDGDITNQRGFYYPTPAAANDGRAAPIHVVVNEWMASNTATIADPADGQFDDWFELFNNADVPADLSGYFLTDSASSPTQFVIPGGTSIAPYGRLLVWADGQPEQNTPTNLDLHVNFQLSKNGEAIALYSPEGILIDGVTFGKQTNDISMGRYPDGSVSIYFMTNATPGFANLLGGAVNTAPHLALPAPQTVWGGQAVTVTLTASDDDLPEQSLVFSLDAGAPIGAAINSDTGLFAWRAPIVAQMTDVDIAVRVTDSGVPTLSDAKSFRITILPQPSIASTVIDTDTISMHWNVIAGRNYQAQYTDNLETPNWISLGDVIPAATGQITVADPIAANRRFYRITEAP